MGRDALPCIICRSPLANVAPDLETNNQPDSGTTFETRGHYGSTAFDPMDGSHLEINLCGPCLETLTSEGSRMISFVLPCLNPYRTTIRCLASLIAHTDLSDAELIIVDDNSTDATRNLEPSAGPLAVRRGSRRSRSA